MPAQSKMLPPPYRGIFDVYPVADIQSPYCQRLSNFNTYNQSLQVRQGDIPYEGISLGGELFNIANYAFGTSLFASFLVAGNVNVLEVTPGSILTSLGTSSGYGVQSNEFNKNIFFWNSGSTAITGTRYDGATFTNSPYTLSGSFAPFLAVGYKNRHYILDSRQNIVAYGAVDAIGGPTINFGLSSILNITAPIYCMGVTSLSDVLEAEQFLFFVSAAGEVIVYGGSYPGDSSWGLKGRFRIPRPVYYNSMIEYRGDALIITDSGLISIRDLFTKGSQVAIDQAITLPVTNRWKNLIKTTKATAPTSLKQIKGVWDYLNNRIIVIFPYYLNAQSVLSTFPEFLIYDLATQSWLEHIFTPGADGFMPILSGTQICLYQEDVCYGINSPSTTQSFVYKKEASGDYKDYFSTVGPAVGYVYDFAIRSAPVDGNTVGITKVSGLELIYRSHNDGPATGLTLTLTSDLGARKTEKANIPNTLGEIRKWFISVGIEGVLTYYDILGTGLDNATAPNFELLGMNVIYEKGNVR